MPPTGQKPQDPLQPSAEVQSPEWGEGWCKGLREILHENLNPDNELLLWMFVEVPPKCEGQRGRKQPGALLTGLTSRQ